MALNSERFMQLTNHKELLLIDLITKNIIIIINSLFSIDKLKYISTNNTRDKK